MANIEKNEQLPLNIEGKLNKLSDNLTSVNEERLVDICKNIPENDLNNQCKNLNKIFWEGLKNKWIDFIVVLNKLERPIGVN